MLYFKLWNLSHFKVTVSPHLSSYPLVSRRKKLITHKSSSRTLWPFSPALIHMSSNPLTCVVTSFSNYTFHSTSFTFLIIPKPVLNAFPFNPSPLLPMGETSLTEPAVRDVSGLHTAPTAHRSIPLPQASDSTQSGRVGAPLDLWRLATNGRSVTLYLWGDSFLAAHINVSSIHKPVPCGKEDDNNVMSLQHGLVGLIISAHSKS